MSASTPMRPRLFVIGLGCLAGALAADRFFKYAVERQMLNGAAGTTTWLGRVGYYPNPGIGLGIQLPTWLSIGLVTLIMLGLATWLVVQYRRIGLIVRWAVGLTLIGAGSNLYDRVRYGYVIDVINVENWSVFNFADVWILAGVFVILIGLSAKGSPPPGKRIITG